MLLYRKIFGIVILFCLVCMSPIAACSVGTSYNYCQKPHVDYDICMDKNSLNKNVELSQMSVNSDIKVKSPKNDPVQNAEALSKMNPGSAAEILEKMNPASAAEVLNNMDPWVVTLIYLKLNKFSAAQILAKTAPVSAADMLNNMNTNVAIGILTPMAPFSAAEILNNMNIDRVTEILSNMDQDKRDDISYFLILSS